MRTGIDATEIAAALLIEARGLVGTDDRSDWPVRAGRSSALGLLTTTWAIYPRRDLTGWNGFALARGALRAAASDGVISQVAPTDVLRDAFDRALASLDEAYAPSLRSRSSAHELMQ